MKRLLIAAIVCTFSAGGIAQAATCKDTATQKKLAGAALASFMKKCKSDATKSCDANAKQRKLAGAAKTSFTKKCITDASGE